LDEELVHEYEGGKCLWLPEPVKRAWRLGKRVLRVVIGLNAEETSYEALESEEAGDEDDPGSHMTEEAGAGFLSRMFFVWYNGMIDLSRKRTLHMKYVPKLLPRHEPEIHAMELEERWKMELKRSDENVEEGSPSLVRAMFYTYRWEYLKAFFPRLVKVVGSFVGPWIIKLLVSFIENPSESTSRVWWGLFLLVILAANLIITSIGLQQYWHITIATSIHMKSGITYLLYSKLLKLSAKSKQSNIAGKLTNLMSSDVSRLQDTVSYLHFLWATPMMMVICFVSVTLLMGVIPTIAGYGVFLGLAPVSAWVAWTLERIRAQNVLLTDARVKATNEIFSTMKTVKVYALEDHFASMASQARRLELASIRYFQVWKAMHNSINFAIVPLMTMATFAAYLALGKQPFAASTAFSVISMYYVLKWPFSMLTQVISSIVESKVSIRRIEEFLALQEQPGMNGKSGKNEMNGMNGSNGSNDSNDEIERGSILISNASFSWDRQSGLPPDLKFINLKCMPGTLTCVIGPVGSGKSSLLNVLLGEIESLPNGGGSSCRLNGSISYAPQVPFLLHATVRENITFGKPFVEEKYLQAIKVCSLQSDFDMLIAGDQTTIGERGINLSGGQKARISMARAVYSDSDIYLLDDPLSAVDAHVGHHLFNSCIKTMLKKKTIILVTHQLQFVTHGDHLVIMQEGSISHQGSPQELKEKGIHIENLLEKFNTLEEEEEEGEKNGEKVGVMEEEIEMNGGIEGAVGIGGVGAESSESSEQGNSSASLLSFFPSSSNILADGVFGLASPSITSSSSSIIHHQHHSINESGNGSLLDANLSSSSSSSPPSSSLRVSQNSSGSLRRSQNGLKKSTQLEMDFAAKRFAEQSEAATSKANLEQKEERAVGRISLSVYKFYFGHKIWWWIFAIIMILAHRGVDVFLKVWIAGWSSSNAPNPPTAASIPSISTATTSSMHSYGSMGEQSVATMTFGGFMNLATFYLSEGVEIMSWPLNSMMSDGGNQDISMVGVEMDQAAVGGNKLSVSTAKFLWVFIIGNLALALLQMVKETMILLVTCSTGRVVYMEMFQRLLRAPMSFFDTTPKGRIAARCSSDTDAMDTQLGGLLTTVCDNLAQILSSLVSIAMSVHWFVFGMIPMCLGYINLYNRFINGYRELARLNGTTKAPLFSQFSETLNGLFTLRAYSAGERFVKKLYVNLDSNQRVYFFGVVSARWLGVRMDILGSFLICGIGLVAIFNRSAANPGLMGMALSYCLLNTELLNGLIRGISDIESRMNSVERIEQYTKIDVERLPIIDGKRPTKGWPSKGEIEFDNVFLRYREGLPLVLNGLSFKILPGEKVGIVGRTGAGKSSLLTALLSLAPLSSGQISIDGLDINQIGVDDLRSKLSIIPQDPCIFDGNVRHNIDPFGKYPDHQIWETLKRVHLADAIHQLPNGLDSELADEGANFSLGQRQLLCVARAILRRSKILLLDEASSSIDLETDYLLQKTLRTEFADCTTITIAHRLATIMDSDRVMVLEGGQLKEFDSPSSLLSNPHSLFSSLHQQAQSSASQ
jgi:ABC-type multidrug transport system fused ATPase/permease subunit